MRIASIVLLLCILSTSYTVAQELYLEHITVDQGIPSNETYQVLEDSTGYLWIVTDRGVVRYDGYSFEEIKIKGSHRINPIFRMHKAADGTIYFLGLKGKIYKHIDGYLVPQQFDIEHSPVINHPGLLIADAFSELGDSFLVSFNSNLGNYVITPSGKLIRAGNYEGLYFDLPKRFYTRSITNSYSKCHKVTIKWTDGKVIVDTIIYDPSKGYLNPYHYQCGDVNLFGIGKTLHIYRNRSKVGEYKFPRNVLSLLVLDTNNLLIGFENGGVGKYQVVGNTIVSTGEQYLKDFSITSIYEDKQGGYWFTTMESGLFYAHPLKAKLWDGAGKIVDIKSRGGQVYVAYQYGTIDVFLNGKKQFPISLQLKPDEFVISLLLNNREQLIAVSNKGYYKLRNGGNAFYSLPGVLLLSAGAAGLYGATKYGTDAYILNEVGSMVGKISLPKRIMSIFVDSKNNVWLGTVDGLYQYKNGTVSTVPNDDTMLTDRIVAIDEIDNKWLVVATLGSGLVISRGPKKYVLNVNNGLASPIINSMQVIGQEIWLGTNKGITQIIFDDGRFNIRHYGRNYGMPTLDVQEFAVANGWLYLKWINKVVAIDAHSRKQVVPIKGPFITTVYHNGKHFNTVSKTIFQYNENDIKINFNSINFANGFFQIFRYKLDDFDADWQITNNREATYTNLPSGKYSFMVQVSDVWGNFLPTTARYDFEVRPAIWQRWWFPYTIALLLLISIILFFKLRFDSIRKKNQLMLDLSESQQRALVQLINPHFIFNILNTVQSAILNENKLSAASIVSRFAKLMRLSMELSREKFVPLSKEIELLSKYIDLEAIRAPGRLAYSIDIDPRVDVERISIPSMLIQPFVENSIKHGIMHLRDRVGHIRIVFSFEGDTLICHIEDNGVGRKFSESIKADQSRHHRSAGIDITLHRLKLLHKEKGVQFNYIIRDEHDNFGVASGTTVIFSIPSKGEI